MTTACRARVISTQKQRAQPLAAPSVSLLGKVFPGRELAPRVSLSRVVTKLSNNLAHGSSTMHGQGISSLRLCAGLINELFP